MSQPISPEWVQPNPMDPRFVADPEAVYGPIRERSAVWWWEEGTAWLITGYPQFVEVIRHPDLVMDRRYWEHYEAPTDPVARAMEDQLDLALPMMGGEAHTRIRSLVSKAFTPRAVAGLAPLIHGILNELIEEVRPKGRMEFVAEFAHRYPTRVISRMLGIPPNSEREVQFKAYSDVFVASVSPYLAAGERREIAQVQARFLALVDEVIEEHRAVSRDDMLSRLIAVEEAGDRLSNPELVALVFGLIMAGSETTANAVGSGLHALLTHPEQLALYRSEPAVRDNAVLELIRFNPPGYGSSRYAKRDVTIDGVEVKRGQLLIASLPAAHYDPAYFPEPRRLDLRRDLREQALFGSGAHFCLGAQLARLELETAFSMLFGSLPGLRLESCGEDIVYAPHPTIRGPAALPVLFDRD